MEADDLRIESSVEQLQRAPEFKNVCRLIANAGSPPQREAVWMAFVKRIKAILKAEVSPS